MGALGTKTHSLVSTVANGGTFTTSYPAGTTQTSLLGSLGGILRLNGTGARYKQQAGGFSATFNTSDITITNDSGVSWAAGDTMTISFGTNHTIPGSFNQSTRVRGITALTAATGTTGDTVNDVGASFTQATLNNNFKVLADKLNAVIDAMKKAGEVNGS